MSDFHSRVRALRKLRGFSAAELAEKADLTEGYIHMIERGARGRRPTLDLARKLARALSVTVDELLDGADVAPDGAEEPVTDDAAEAP